MEAKTSELADGAAASSFCALSVVVVAAGVAVRLVVFEHVPDGGKGVVLQRYVRALTADPRSKPAVRGSEVRVLRTPRGERGQAECCGEPPVARAGSARARFAGRLVVPRGYSGPGGQVARSGEPFHERAGLRGRTYRLRCARRQEWPAAAESAAPMGAQSLDPAGRLIEEFGKLVNQA